MDYIPVVDLIDSQEMGLPVEENHSGSKRNDPPVIQVIENDRKRKRSLTETDVSNLCQRVNTLENLLQSSTSPINTGIPREDFKKCLKRIKRLEERVESIEKIMNGIGNLFHTGNGVRNENQIGSTHVLEEHTSDSRGLSSALTSSSATLPAAVSSATALPATVPLAAALPVPAPLAAGPSRATQILKVTANQPLPPPRQSLDVCNGGNTSLNGGETINDDDDEVENIEIQNIPIKQELFDRQNTTAVLGPNTNLRFDTDGRICVFICGKARKIRNREEYVATYCWSISDSMVQKEQYLSELKTSHIKIQAEILAAIFALNCLRRMFPVEDLKVTIVARWPKLVETISKTQLYPFKETCDCSEFPCEDNPERWRTVDSFAKHYPDDLPRLMLEQEGIDIKWLSNGSAEIPDSYARFINFPVLMQSSRR